ncbi:MAG: hypothetical protein WBR29_03055 [Gammaproteobacteria bacterium]
MRPIKIAFVGALILASISLAGAQIYNQFGPANGVLVGQTTTPQTTAAASSNIISLWSNTCNDDTYLRGDGVCATPPGSGGGTVNSVALADGSTTPLYSVTGSPVTDTGTLTFTLMTQDANCVVAGPTSGSAAQPTCRAMVDSDLPAGPASGGAPDSFGYQGTPVNSQSGNYTVAASDNGKSIVEGATGTISIPCDTLGAGFVTTIVTTGGTSTVTASSGTLYWGNGTDTSGNRTITAIGVATVIVTSTNCVIVGSGVS